ncbi:NAD(P)H-hydrate dehydratase [Candidatus Uhrbacteria bacterium]|nr:NAD(P)H-hydrate dehydratase [Candidatus Uhrbacteria bacterium]
MNLTTIYSRRSAWSHKGDFGAVLVIGGSSNHTGSPIFNAGAALRAGTDLTYLVGPKRAMDVAACSMPDFITHPLDGELSARHVSYVLKLSRKATACIIGGGLARTSETYRTIREILSKISVPLVIDAEAIRAVGQNATCVKGKIAILTPHADEFFALTDVRVTQSVRVREQEVRNAAKRFCTIILLKGNTDIISDGSKCIRNKTGTPYMTKGGCGDTLAGICGALLARGIDPLRAACAAAYINGRAGEKAAKKYGEGMLASDLLHEIANVICNPKKS